MAGCGREIILADTDIGIRIFLPQLFAHCGNLLKHGIVVLAVYYQFSITVATGGHGTNQTIKCGRTALADNHTVNSRVLFQFIAHTEQLVANLSGIRSRREKTLHYKLFIVKIREEEVLYLRHTEHTQDQQSECHGYCGFLVADKKTDDVPYKTVYRRIHNHTVTACRLFLTQRQP